MTTANATPKMLGEELVRWRTGAGLTLEQIAAETKVSARILGALENGNYKHLPEKVFCRNFVRQYAAMVGADPQPLLAAFDQAWERHLLASGMHPALVEVEDEAVSRTIRWRFWVPIGLGAAILLAVGVFILRGSPIAPDLKPDPRRAATMRPSPTAPLPIRGLPPLPSPTSTQAADDAATEGGHVSIRIVIRSGRECWFHARDRAGLQEQQLLGSGEQAELTLEEPVKLTLGNAGAVSLEVNGREFAELGSLGQVVHLEISESGVAPLTGSLDTDD